MRLGAETLLERAVRVAHEARLHPVFGVISPDLQLNPAPLGMIAVVNEEATEGIASSIRAGLRALRADGPEVTGAVLLACDQPAVTAEHLQELASGGSELIASIYCGRKGIPAYFPNSAFSGLLNLRGDIGARDLLRDARAISLPGGEIDVDTVEDLRQARQFLSRLR